MRTITTSSWRGLLSASLLVALSIDPATAVTRHGEPRPIAREVTVASWYGPGFHGKRTASGSVFDMRKLTAAHRTIRLGTRVKVTALSTGRSVVVAITDRGPYVAGRGIDLSYAAARVLGVVNQGVARVRIEPDRSQERPFRQQPPKKLDPIGPNGPTPILMASSSTSVNWLPRAIVE